MRPISDSAVFPSVLGQGDEAVAES